MARTASHRSLRGVVSRLLHGRRRPAIAAVAILFGLAAVVHTPQTESSFTKGTGNPGNAFGAAASFCPPAKTPTWMTGMESGLVATGAAGPFQNITTTAGPITADSSVVRTGTYSLKIDDASGSAVSSISTDITDVALINMRFAIRVASVPAADVKDFVKIAESGTDPRLGFDKASGKITMEFSSVVLSSVTLAANTWYVIDLRINTAADPHTVDWRINGVAQTQATYSQVAGTIGSVSWGTSSVNTDIYTMYLDDILITTGASDYPIGDGRIYPMVPNGMGTITNPNSYLKDTATATNISSTSWGLLDEVPFAGRTDYIRQTTASTGNYANVNFTDVVTTGCVNAVNAIVSLYSSSTTTNQARTSIFEGANETVVHDDDASPGTAASEFRSAFINPATGTWDNTKLSSLQARIGAAANTGSQPYWDAIRIEYDQAP